MELHPLNYVFGGFCTLIAFFLLRLAARTASTMWRSSHLGTTSITLPVDTLLPPSLNEADRTMKALGFYIVLQTAVEIEGESAPRLLLIYRHTEHSIIANVQAVGTNGQYAVNLMTLLQNKLIGTSFPNRIHADTPTLHARYASTSLDAAYQYHVSQIQRYGENEFIPLEDPQEYLKHTETVMYAQNTEFNALNRKSAWATLMFFGGAALSIFLLGWLPVGSALFERAGVESATAYNLVFFPLLLSAGLTIGAMIFNNQLWNKLQPVDAKPLT